MKEKNYLFLVVFLICGFFKSHAQCGVTAGNDTTIVCGGSVQLNSIPLSAPDSISWSPLFGLSDTTIANPIATPNITTTYVVTTYTGVCIAKDSITITINPLTVDSGTDKNLVCGGSVQLDSILSNYTGAGMLTYAWSPAAGLNDTTIANPTAAVIQTTKYYVSVKTPNGCLSIDTVLVTVNPMLIYAGVDKKMVCGSVVELDSALSNYTGPGILTYSWSPATGLDNPAIANPTANITHTTTYYLTITSSNGCSGLDSATVYVDSLKAEAGNNKTIVCGASAQLDNVSSNYTGTGVLTYSWSPAGGLSATNIPNPVATVKQTTTYYVTITTPNGCSAVDSITVQVDLLKADAGGDKILSCGNSVQLDYVNSNYTGTGNLTYSWFPTTGLSNTTIPNPSVTVKQQTTYVVTVTTPNGCVATDTVTVYVGPLTVDAGNDRDIVCGEGIQLGTITNYNGTGTAYAWTPAIGLNLSNIANPIASPLQTTTFYVKITTPSGCTATDSVKITAHVFEADAGQDKTLVCGGQAQLEVVTNYSGIGSLSYAWTPTTGLNLSNIANPKASVSTNTTFYVMVTTPNGCKAYDTVDVLVGTLKAVAGTDKTITCGGQGQLEVTTNYTGTGTLSYAWTPSSGLNLSNIYNPIVSVTQNTRFVVKVQSLNGCIAYDTIDVNVSPLTVNVGLDKSLTCGKSVQLDSAITNYNGTGTLSYSWSPKTGLNYSNIANPITTVGGITYTLTVFSPFGACKATDQVEVDYIPLSGTNICIVGLDSTNKNVVVWPKAIEGAIDSFLVYRETTAGNYIKVGSVSQKAATMYRDASSQPDIKSNKYKVSMKDSCGVETSLSAAHKTMYLTVTKGTGNDVNLKWEKYDAITVSSYIIYRGISKTNLQFIGATAGANDEYIDSGAPAGTVYYQIEITNAIACNSSKPMNTSRSNIASSSPIGIYEYQNNFAFSIYPNPASELLTVNVDLVNNKNMVLTIYNSLGALVKTMTVDHNSQQLNVSDLTNGFYMVELKAANVTSKQKLVIQR